MSDTEKLRELALAATPGPWTLEKVNVGYVNEEWGLTGPTVKTPNGRSTPVVIGTPWGPNAAFIAAACPSTVVALLDRIDELEANAVRMREYRFALEGIATDGKGNPVGQPAERGKGGP